MVNAVRKCLQFALVPLLRPWRNPTCEEIRNKAFASHERCYLTPNKDAPSVYDLDCTDFDEIFWTIKGVFGTARESLKGMWVVSNQCGRLSKIKNCYRGLSGPVRMYNLLIKKFQERKRGSTDPLPEADAQSRFTDEVGSAIAIALKCNTDVMDWLAYTGSVVDPDNLEIVMLLADKKALGIVSTPIPSINFNQTIQEFASAVKHGQLPLKVDGYNVWVKTLASCSDKACNNTQTLAMSDKTPNWNGASGISGGNFGLCGAIAVLIVMMDKLFY